MCRQQRHTFYQSSLIMKLIFGCGYLGARVARLWHEAGHSVAVVTRSPARAEGFAHHGYQSIVADVTQAESLLVMRELPTAESVLFAVGFDRSAGQKIEAVYAGGVRNVLAALPADSGRFLYISTTGVYGNAGGGWVDETTPPRPGREGGLAALAAEKALAAHALGNSGVILRLAGLYGPGRVPYLEQLRAGDVIPAAGAGHLNLIHVDDSSRAVLAAADLPHFADGPRVYCVSDGSPVTREEYFKEIARRIGAPPPRLVPPEPGSPRLARGEADRRVKNQRMLAELRVRLMYPDYRAGLAAILQA
jgi:nucleoside-diphosphate-sugar epimerase